MYETFLSSFSSGAFVSLCYRVHKYLKKNQISLLEDTWKIAKAAYFFILLDGFSMKFYTSIAHYRITTKMQEMSKNKALDRIGAVLL